MGWPSAEERVARAKQCQHWPDCSNCLSKEIPHLANTTRGSKDDWTAVTKREANIVLSAAYTCFDHLG